MHDDTSTTRSGALRTVARWSAVPIIGAAAFTALLGTSAVGAAPPPPAPPGPHAPPAPPAPRSDIHFDFNARDISGGSGAVTMNGGGDFTPGSDFTPLPTVGHADGHFRCTSTVSAGPLAGCAAGQGTHWTAAVLATTGFKCTAADPAGLKTAVTTNDTVAFRASFFDGGPRDAAAFTANAIVSTTDIAPDVPGFQNAWVQGVGCGSAMVHFDHHGKG